MTANKHKYGLQFWLLCASSFMFFMSFNMVIPELPDYLTSLGGEDYKGLFISLFTLAAGLSRPFSGKIADQVGRIPVMIFGSVVCVVCGLLYPVLTSVAGFLLLRFFHGFSTGFKPTGTTAYVADLVPFNIRGEALGYLGFFATLGTALGNAVGSPIASAYSYNGLFYISSLTALLSVVVLIGMKETLAERQKFSHRHLTLKRNEIFEPKVWPAFIVMALSYFSFGMILTIIPDFSSYLGFANKGMFFTCFTLSSLLIRIVAGKASDKYGRVIVLKITYFLMTAAMIYLGLVSSRSEFIIAALFFGIPTGMNYPTIFAWTIDLSDEKYRGKAMATVYIALELGIGIGAVISAWIYNNDDNRFLHTFWTGAVATFLSFIYLIWYTRHRRPLERHTP
ncbi:MFS transporter [Fulvivirgaceae bacterium BMA12]|uniref:MFS transporter n=1 Tax=Agaribacillus aureus TaxID=3051825 RepID=A0ABT8L1G2_9BACT|nr:MFS transporter [Fulvivirgaceae bacterium BMA12]